jgi:uncharacterized protein YjdB
MRSTNLRHIAAVAVTVLGFIACSDSSSPESTSPNAESKLFVTLSVQSDTIAETHSTSISARVTDQTGFVKAVPVQWKSSDASVASVIAGTVTGVSAGSAMIIAFAGSAADTALIVVTPREYVLDVQPSAAIVAVGDTIGFQATVRTKDGDLVSVTNLAWSSSDTVAARFVNGSSLVGTSEGELSVNAETAYGRGTGSVKVFRTPVASVTITPGTANVYKGAQIELDVTLRDQQGRLTEGTVTFGSSDYSKATVNQDGVVTGIGSGSVVITATSGTKTGSATVNVLGTPASSVSLVVPDTVPLGVEVQATATPLDASGTAITDRTIAYQSSNPSVATITSTGVVKGVAQGTTTISAIVDAKIASKKVSVGGRRATSLTISPTSPSVSTGKQSQLTAKVLDQTGVEMTGQTFNWSSANASIAGVSSTGLVTGVSAGSTSITATSNGLSSSVVLSVVSAPVASVQITPATLSVVVGGSATLMASAFDADGNILSGRAATWATQNPTVASVNSSGVLSAIAAGSTTVTATIEGKSSSMTVSVGSAPVAPVASVTVSLANPTLSVGQQTQASAVLKDAQGNVLTRAITWTSLDTAVAKVSASGLVTAYAGGTVAIMAGSEGVSGSASLTVNTPSPVAVAQVILDAPKLDLLVNESVQSVVTLKDAQGNTLLGRTITYSTENSTIVTVSATGVIKGVGAGSARVTATSGGVSGSLVFRVTAPTQTLTSIVVTAPSTSLSVGQTTQASAVAKDAQGNPMTGVSFTWTTSNPGVATVSSTGMVSAVAAGNATISAAASGVIGSMSVTTLSPAVAAVIVNVNSSLQVGGTTQASALAKDAGGNTLTGKTFVWSSNATSVATVSASGLVSGLSAGTAQIRATADGVAGSATVTVSTATASLSVPPEMPRVTPSWQDPYPGRPCSVTVPAGGNVTAALSSARGGSVVCLSAGATYGQTQLPARAAGDTGWIVLRTAGSLPSEGTRARPSTSSNYAIISTYNVECALQTAPGTYGWYVSGLRLTTHAPTTLNPTTYQIVCLGSSGGEQDAMSEVPQNIVLSRNWIDGKDGHIQRCIGLNTGATAIVDNWIANCHIKGFEGHGIGGWNGPGPYLIRNNYIEAAGINIMFGGATPSIPNLKAFDVTIQRNHVNKPLSWKGVWTAKNLLETKNAARVLVEENVFENSWTDAQTGIGILFKSSNDQGNCNWCQTSDVTYRRNLLRGAETGIGITAGENYCRQMNPFVSGWCIIPGEVPPATARVQVVDNVFDELGSTAWGGKGIYIGPVHSSTGPTDVVLERNLTAQAAGKLVAHGLLIANPGAPRATFKDNVWSHGTYTILSGEGLMGVEAFNAGAPGALWQNMWFVKSPNHTEGTTTLPPGTTVVTSETSLASQIRSTVSAAISGVVIVP